MEFATLKLTTSWNFNLSSFLAQKVLFMSLFNCLFLFVCQNHNGHSFFTEQFKVAAVCEYCNDPIPLLEKGEFCQGIEIYIDMHTYMSCACDSALFMLAIIFIHVKDAVCLW